MLDKKYFLIIILSLIIFTPPFVIRNFYLMETAFSRVLSARIKPTVQLSVMPHHQEHSLSCEIATLKMALSVYGIDIAESEILEYLPFDATPKNKNIWGDPNKGFVGNIDGKSITSGYGVYWEPLAKIGDRWRQTEILYNAEIKDLVMHLNSGHPIILWGYIGSGKKISWLTPENKEIQAIKGEHTRLLIGYMGEPQNPDKFILIDPIYGYLTWNRNTFIKQWDSFGRVALIIY